METRPPAPGRPNHTAHDGNPYLGRKWSRLHAFGDRRQRPWVSAGSRRRRGRGRRTQPTIQAAGRNRQRHHCGNRIVGRPSGTLGLGRDGRRGLAITGPGAEGLVGSSPCPRSRATGVITSTGECGLTVCGRNTSSPTKRLTTTPTTARYSPLADPISHRRALTASLQSPLRVVRSVAAP